MNEFMWFIYFADVVPAAGRFFGLAAVASFIAVIIIGGGGFGILVDSKAFDAAAEGDASAVNAVKWYKRLTGTVICAFFIASAAAIVIPEKQTIYAMAAVKAAEELSRTGIATKAKEAIELTVDDIIKKYTPKKEKEGK